MKNIVVATKPNIGYYQIMVESCKKNNIELVVLGLNKKWEGFTMRFKLWMDYLNTLDDNEIVMLNDAYDVVILQDSSIILNKFKKFNKRVIFAIQSGFLTEMLFPKCLDKVICMGNIIGYVKDIKNIIKIIVENKDLWEKYKNDDQYIFNKICSKSDIIKSLIGLDTKREIFFVVPDTNRYKFKYILNGDIDDLKMINKNIVNQDNNPIAVLHLSSNMNGKKYLEYLNYDTSSISFITEKYKFKQFLSLYSNIILTIIFLVLLVLVIKFRKYLYKLIKNKK